MKFNCVPDATPFHAARRNFTFLSLLLLLLFIILVPIGYSFTRYIIIVGNYSNWLPTLFYRLQPSGECGPFRGQPFMYSIVNNTISDFNCDARRAISFFGPAGFIGPLIVLLLWVPLMTMPLMQYDNYYRMIIYSLLVVMRARNMTISLLKKQLVLVSALANSVIVSR